MSASSTFIPSRRGSAASRSVLSESDSSRSLSDSFIPGIVAQKIFWIYLVLGLAAYVFLFFIVRERNQNVHAWARVPCWLANPFVLTVIVLIVVVLAAYATAVTHGLSTMNWGAGVGGLYVLALVLFVVIAWLTYRAHNFVAAFYVNILAVVVVVLHFLGVWRHHKSAALLVVPLALVFTTSLYYLWFMADESTDCSDACGPVYEVSLPTA